MTTPKQPVLRPAAMARHLYGRWFDVSSMTEIFAAQDNFSQEPDVERQYAHCQLAYLGILAVDRLEQRLATIHETLCHLTGAGIAIADVVTATVQGVEVLEEIPPGQPPSHVSSITHPTMPSPVVQRLEPRAPDTHALRVQRFMTDRQFPPATDAATEGKDALVETLVSSALASSALAQTEGGSGDGR